MADGDTGTNMLLRTVTALENAAAATTRPPARRALRRPGATPALMGARGNSGMILSQLVRGAADALGP